MKKRLITSLLLILIISIFVLGNTVKADQISPMYDLTGTWELRGLSVELSRCNDPVSIEMIELEISITQSGNEITMIFPDEPSNQSFEGFTSIRSLVSISSDESQMTVLMGSVSLNANRIFGNIIFFDKHECPDAEIGWTGYVLNRI